MFSLGHGISSAIRGVGQRIADCPKESRDKVTVLALTVIYIASMHYGPTIAEAISKGQISSLIGRSLVQMVPYFTGSVFVGILYGLKYVYPCNGAQMPAPRFAQSTIISRQAAPAA